MNILEEIVAHKRVELVDFKKKQPLHELKSASKPVVPSFVKSIRSVPIGLIAEVKHRSPSAGVIRSPFVPAEIARAYEAAGAQAVSVLMDQKFFGGGEPHFREVRETVKLPMLYKEFVVDAWQVWHAASLGASAVLLIAAVLHQAELVRLLVECGAAKVEALVEVHDEAEMKRVAALNAPCIGVNNRDLKTFKVSLDTTLRLRDLAPPGCTLVSESGIRTATDVLRLRSAGIHAILVGEQLLRQSDPAQAVRELMNVTPADHADGRR